MHLPTSCANARHIEHGTISHRYISSLMEVHLCVQGTKRIMYLEENVAALQIKVTVQGLADLDAVFKGHPWRPVPLRGRQVLTRPVQEAGRR